MEPQVNYDQRYSGLLTVYRLRSFAAAAVELSLTASAVSKQIRSLESDLYPQRQQAYSNQSLRSDSAVRGENRRPVRPDAAGAGLNGSQCPPPRRRGDAERGEQRDLAGVDPVRVGA